MRKHKLTPVALAGALAVTSLLVWTTPQGRRDFAGQTADQVALQRETARADDLAGQVKALQAKLMAGHPEVMDKVQWARAEDLAQQVSLLEDKVMKGKPAVVDLVQLARADDLKGQVATLEAKVSKLSARAGALERQAAMLDVQEARADDLSKRVAALTAALSAPRPAVQDPVLLAQAQDLRNQVQELSNRLKQPHTPPAPPVTARYTRAQILAADHLFGLYTAQSPFDYGEFNQVQASLGRSADVSGYFQSWDTDFRPDAVKAAWSRGQIPLMTWESQSQVGVVSSTAPEYSLKSIYGGDHDAYLHKYAKDIVATGLPLVIRFDHEMNGTWYPWSEVRGWDGGSVNGNKKGDYVKAWRHVHDVFAAEGANKLVVWLWSPNRVNKIPSQANPSAFYPGDAYVDWIGMSGYNRIGDAAPTFDDTYGKTLPLLRASGDKPIFLSEIGATEAGGHKAQWTSGLFRSLALPANHDIVGFAWFNLTVTSSSGSSTTTNDWRINSTGPVTRAAATGLATDGFGVAR